MVLDIEEDRQLFIELIGQMRIAPTSAAHLTAARLLAALEAATVATGEKPAKPVAPKR